MGECMWCMNSFFGLRHHFYGACPQKYPMDMAHVGVAKRSVCPITPKVCQKKGRGGQACQKKGRGGQTCQMKLDLKIQFIPPRWQVGGRQIYLSIFFSSFFNRLFTYFLEQFFIEHIFNKCYLKKYCIYSLINI